MSKKNLELVSTKKLLRELFGRFDNAGFVGMKLGESGPESVSISRTWAGNAHTVAGLCHDLATTAIDNFNCQSQPKE